MLQLVEFRLIFARGWLYASRNAACRCFFMSANTFSRTAFAPALVGSRAASFACAAVTVFEGFFSCAAL